MGRVISGSMMTKTPSVKFTRENTPDMPGLWFIGKKVGQKAYKDSLIFEFAIEEADERLPILMPTETKGVYKNADVGPGDKVAIWGQIKDGVPNQLADKLAQTRNDDRVKVTFEGKKLNEKSGRSYNSFVVEVL